MTILNGTSTVLQVNSSGAAPPADTTAPVLQTVATSADGLTVTLTYNEALDTGSTPATGDFSFSPSKTISNVNVTGSTVVLTVSVAFGSGDTITLNYTAASNPIQDSAGNDAVNLSGQSVTNNVAGSYSAEASAVFALLDSQPTATIKGYMATLIDDLVANGDWAELDVFQVYAIDTAANAVLDWKGNSNADNTQSSLTHNANESFTFVNSGSLPTGFTPSTDGVQYQSDDASIGVYVLTNTDSTDQRHLMYAGAGTDFAWNQRTVASRLDMESDGVTEAITTYPTGWPAESMIATVQTAPVGSETAAYVNGVQVGAPAGTGTRAVPTDELWLGKRNGSGNGIAGKICCFWAGSSSIDQANIVSAFNTYLTSMGVI